MAFSGNGPVERSKMQTIRYKISRSTVILFEQILEIQKCVRMMRAGDKVTVYRQCINN